MLPGVDLKNSKSPGSSSRGYARDFSHYFSPLLSLQRLFKLHFGLSNGFGIEIQRFKGVPAGNGTLEPPGSAPVCVWHECLLFEEYCLNFPGLLWINSSHSSRLFIAVTSL